MCWKAQMSADKKLKKNILYRIYTSHFSRSSASVGLSEIHSQKLQSLRGAAVLHAIAGVSDFVKWFYVNKETQVWVWDVLGIMSLSVLQYSQYSPSQVFPVFASEIWNHHKHESDPILQSSTQPFMAHLQFKIKPLFLDSF